MIKLILKVLLSPLKIIPLRREYIIIQSTNPNTYNDNPKYLYEYLFKKGLKIYFFSNNKKIIHYFKKKNFKYISYFNLIKIIFITLKAKIIIDGGSNYFNFLNLVNKNAIKVHIGHGMGNKIVLKGKKGGNNSPDKY